MNQVPPTAIPKKSHLRAIVGGATGVNGKFDANGVKNKGQQVTAQVSATGNIVYMPGAKGFANLSADQARQVSTAIQRGKDRTASEALAQKILETASVDPKFRNAILRESAGAKGNQFRAALGDLTEHVSDKTLRKTARQLGAGQQVGIRQDLGASIDQIRNRPDLDNRLGAIKTEEQRLLGGVQAMAAVSASAALAVTSGLNSVAKEVVDRRDAVTLDNKQDELVKSQLASIVVPNHAPLQSGASLDELEAAKRASAQVESIAPAGSIESQAVKAQVASKQAEVQAQEAKIEQELIEQGDLENNPSLITEIASDAIRVIETTVEVAAVGVIAGVAVTEGIGQVLEMPLPAMPGTPIV